MTALTNSTTTSAEVVADGWRRWAPRPEVLLLIVALGWTVLAKTRVLIGLEPERLFSMLLATTLPDFAFFGFLLAGFSSLYLLGLRNAAARITIVLAGLTALWAVLNAAWLLSTSVQLQPGVLGVLAKDPVNFWPTVQAHLIATPLYALPIVATVLFGAGWFVFRTIRPVRMIHRRLMHRNILIIALLLAVGSLMLHVIDRRTEPAVFSGRVIGFSSHWSAVQSSLGLIGPKVDDRDIVPARHVPRIGERQLVAPVGGSRPNVVIIFLESVSYDASSLSGRTPATTPTLAMLAEQGIELSRTYVSVPQTNKALFGALTGCTPDIQPDSAESVLVDRPYESLASILNRVGYRSAFFELADGRFECAPGLFTNLAFDWAWFFENLEDDAARLNYLSADDFRMIKPMFDWVDDSEDPFLLSMITTVAHDPYTLPQWYEPNPADDRYQRYLRAVEFSDEFVRRVMNELETRGLTDNTLLCVIGDHGDSFRPEARRGRFVPYEEVIRVPWVMHWPGQIQPGTTVNHMVSQLDLTPTVLALLGWDVSGGKFDGVNALDVDHERRLFFASWYKDSPMGYVDNARKIIYWPYLDSVFEIDLARDGNEQNPIVLEGPAKQRAIDRILAWRDQSQFAIDEDRVSRRTLFERWDVACSGRTAWATYEPKLP